MRISFFTYSFDSFATAVEIFYWLEYDCFRPVMDTSLCILTNLQIEIITAILGTVRQDKNNPGKIYKCATQRDFFRILG